MFIVIVVLALLFYIRERRQTGGGIVKGLPLREQILAWLRKLWARLRGQARTLQDTLVRVRESAGDAEPAQAKRSRWSFLRVSSLTPRDQLRFFYLSTVRRAGDRGVKREPASTPSEYVHDLKQNWPEADVGLDDLTKAFLKARYSDKEISDEDVPPVKEIWKGVRRELSQKPAPKQDGDERAGEEG